MMYNYYKALTTAVIIFASFTSMVAQDDVYFVNKRAKKNKEVKAKVEQESQRNVPVQIVYVDEDSPVNVKGSTRDVDEYNRRGRSNSHGRIVENPDGSFSYQLPANDTLYVIEDSMAVTTRSLANDAYAQGYNEGYQDGEDYALTRRLNRFGYADVYMSPWRYGYYDPFFWDDYYWGYDPYWYGGYYGWSRPYWGYSGYYGWRGYWGYNPYWYGGYYGWGYPYYGGYYYGGRSYGRRHDSWTDGSHTRRYRGQTGRSAGFNRGGTNNGTSTGATGRTRSFNIRQSNNVGQSNVPSIQRGTSSSGSSSRVGSFGNSRSSSSSSSVSSSSRNSSFGSSSSSSRSGGFSNSSSSSGGFSGGSRGGGFTGGSRGGGGGRGR